MDITGSYTAKKSDCKKIFAACPRPFLQGSKKHVSSVYDPQILTLALQKIKISFIALTATLTLMLTAKAFGQQYASKQFYLIDSLDLGPLVKADRLLLDSCLRVYHAAKQDTQRVEALNGICGNLMDESWQKYQHFQYRLIDKMLNALTAEKQDGPKRPEIQYLKMSMAAALNNIGFIHTGQGKIPQALDCYNKSLKILEELGEKYGISNAFNAAFR